MTHEFEAVDLPDLKPCPFCGATPIDRYGAAIGVPEPIKRGPACDECGASTQITGNASIDANLWNTRAPRSEEDQAGLLTALTDLMIEWRDDGASSYYMPDPERPVVVEAAQRFLEDNHV